ncbi:hypothetical protein AAC387_Pa06g2067 [Persea americana]
MPSLHNVPPPEQPRHSRQHTRQGDKSVTKLGEKSVRARSQSHHQANLDDEDPVQDGIRAQNRLIQEQEELIRRLKLQLQERGGARSPPPVRSHSSGPLPRHNQAPPPSHERDLRHVLDKRRDRVHDEKGSSSSRVRADPKKQHWLPEDEAEMKQWLDQHIKQTIRQNMETAGIVRDQYNTFEAEDNGTSPFSTDIRRFTLPEKFNVPRFILYDGTSDPAAHLRHFIPRMSISGDDDYLNCQVFSSSLEDLPL